MHLYILRCCNYPSVHPDRCPRDQRLSFALAWKRRSAPPDALRCHLAKQSSELRNCKNWAAPQRTHMALQCKVEICSLMFISEHLVCFWDQCMNMSLSNQLNFGSTWVSWMFYRECSVSWLVCHLSYSSCRNITGEVVKRANASKMAIFRDPIGHLVTPSPKTSYALQHSKDHVRSTR